VSLQGVFPGSLPYCGSNHKVQGRTEPAATCRGNSLDLRVQGSPVIVGIHPRLGALHRKYYRIAHCALETLQQVSGVSLKTVT
jgi:hypothetical protein